MLRYLNKRVSCSSRRPKSGLQSSIKWKTDSNLKSRFRINFGLICRKLRQSAGVDWLEWILIQRPQWMKIRKRRNLQKSRSLAKPCWHGDVHRHILWKVLISYGFLPKRICTWWYYTCTSLACLQLLKFWNWIILKGNNVCLHFMHRRDFRLFYLFISVECWCVLCHIGYV